MEIKRFIRDVYYSARRKYTSRKLLEESLSDYGSRQKEPVVVFDIGARWGISEPYDKLKRLGDGVYSVGFEPDAQEAEKLQAQGQFTRAIPVALGDRIEERTLHMAKDPGCSSLFLPDMGNIAKFTDSRQFETTGEIVVPLTTLENAISEFDLPAPDFIKVDCEGAELMIFSGMGDHLNHVIGVTFEARQSPFYKGEPCLSGLLEFFARQDFVVLDINPIGSFWGAKVMFDVVMIRHPLSYRTEREFILGKMFCLIHENLAYAKRIQELWDRHNAAGK